MLSAKQDGAAHAREARAAKRWSCGPRRPGQPPDGASDEKQPAFGSEPKLPVGRCIRTAMPRFFLHVRDGERLIEDPDGSELPDLEAARAEALAGARDLLAEQLGAGKTLDGQRIEICDPAGRVLAKVLFRDAFKLGQGEGACHVHVRRPNRPSRAPHGITELKRRPARFFDGVEGRMFPRERTGKQGFQTRGRAEAHGLLSNGRIVHPCPGSSRDDECTSGRLIVR